MGTKHTNHKDADQVKLLLSELLKIEQKEPKNWANWADEETLRLLAEIVNVLEQEIKTGRLNEDWELTNLLSKIIELTDDDQ